MSVGGGALETPSPAASREGLAQGLAESEEGLFCPKLTLVFSLLVQ